MAIEEASPLPRIGVVIPVFGHSRLVAEAIVSVIRQDYQGPIDTVIVIDGDPNDETLQTVSSFVGARNRTISAVFRANGRLPAARNTGIRFLMARFDDLFAVQFLDADNRLAPSSVRAFTKVLTNRPDAAWAYPDVSFFGLSSAYGGVDVRVTGLGYSRFRHLLGNICEAGSMVRAEVFQRGVFFDESFKYGYEDWEFWLQCLDLGMVGARVEDAGFLYRRRADSMLADADRMSDDIVGKIKQKHAKLFSRASVWTFFADEFRPLIAANADGTTLSLSTSDRSEQVGEAEIAALIGKTYLHYNHAYMPKWVLYPLDANIQAPTISLNLLEKLILHSVTTEPIFIGRRGNLSAERSLQSAWGAFPMIGLLAGSEPPEELARHPTVSWIRAAAKAAAAAPAWLSPRRYAGPASFRIEGFLRDTSHPTDKAAAQQAGSKPRCLIVHGGRAKTDTELMAALRHAYDVVAVDLDTIDPEKLYRQTVYLGAPLSYRAYGFAYEMLADVAFAFDTLYIVDEFSYLFLSGQWKRGPKIIFVADNFSADQRIAMQGVEHSVSTIVCSEKELRQLSAGGIPAHKLETRRHHLAHLTGQGGTARPNVRRREKA